MHYGHHAASAPKPPDGTQVPDQSAPSGSAPNAYGQLTDHTGQPQPSVIPQPTSALQPPPPTTASTMNPFAHEPNDFRARFHRSLIAPSPFGAAGAEGTNGETGLDPHLTTKSAVAMAMDAQLGQARDEAASVAGKLDR